MCSSVVERLEVKCLLNPPWVSLHNNYCINPERPPALQAWFFLSQTVVSVGSETLNHCYTVYHI